MAQSEISGQYPTIVVAGLAGAGKTTFVRAISEPAGIISTVERDAGGQMMTCEVGRVTLRGATGVQVLALPDTLPEDVFRALPPNILGVVLLVDATAAARLSAARELLDRFAANGQRCLVAATRADRGDALPLSYLRVRLDLPPQIPLVACDATRPDSVRAALIHLLHLVIEERGTGPLPD